MIGDLSAGAGAIPETGTPNDPKQAVGATLGAAAISLSAAALAVASGDEATARQGLDEAIAHVEEIVTLMSAFGAEC